MKGILLFNPWSARYGYRIPNSILQIAGALKGEVPYEIIDGNREKDALQKIEIALDSGEYDVFGCTVMPGPQLKQAIPFTQKIKEKYPNISIIWGGYFASNQWKVVMDSGCVDYIVDGPADDSILPLLKCLEKGEEASDVVNLIYRKDGAIVQTRKVAIPDMDAIASFPYDELFKRYSAEGYLKKTFLGQRTAAYHSSFGCPFKCSFCAVVPIYNARWQGLPVDRVLNDLESLQTKYGIDAVEFHDNNFFTNRERTVEIAKGLIGRGIKWWGEGRIDTMNKYSDDDLRILKSSGCEMIFFGAESGDDEILAEMNKGGTQTAQEILDFAIRLKKIGIIPEYSFVLGTPADSEEEVRRRIDSDINFIRKVKEANPDTEIIIYLYSPVAVESSDLYQNVLDSGFRFPKNLDDWLEDQWAKFDERKNPMTPWLKASMVDRIRNFETVLNGYYPTVSDFKLSSSQRKTMKVASSWRYKRELYGFPMEIKVIQKLWLKYRQPEIEGMYME